MRFLVDECAGPALATWLEQQGHDVFSVFDSWRGAEDDPIIERAYADQRILVTADKDFGEKVFRTLKPHRGVVLMRLEDERAANKIAVMRRLLDAHADSLPDAFVVVTESRVRFSRLRAV